MTKNHLLPSVRAHVLMRAEKPVMRNSAGMARPQIVLMTHSTLPLR